MSSAIETRAIPATGILQEWVAKLGLRHQGVLLTVIRGCDTAAKRDVSKDFTRALRGLILNTHCANPEDAKSFIEVVPLWELAGRAMDFIGNADPLPHHFVMHVVHAVEVIAYCHPDQTTRSALFGIYTDFCRRLHLLAEPHCEMEWRLNADEETFARQQ